MSGTSSSGGIVTSGGIVSSDIMFDGLTPTTPGGELQVSGKAALVDSTDHTVVLGGVSYALGDVLEAVAARAVVVGSSGTNIGNNPVDTDGTSLTEALTKGSVTPVKTITASGATEIPIPASGDIAYAVNATADATLQFSGTPAAAQSQVITLYISPTTHTVTLPTTNVVPDENVTLPIAAPTDGISYMEISYRAVAGRATITGGVN